MTNQTTQISAISKAAEVYMLKAVDGYLKQALHTPPSTLYVIRKDWKALTEEHELLLELFKEAASGNLDKTALFAKDSFKSVRDEIASSLHEVVPQLNKEFDYILATVINAGIICSGKIQHVDLLKAHISINYHKFKSTFGDTDSELLQFDITNDFCYFGNIIIVDLIFLSIIEFLLHEIRKTGSGNILISDEDWGREKIIEFRCTAASSQEVIEHVFDSVTDDGIDLAFCKKAVQLFRGDMKVALNNEGHIIFTLTIREIDKKVTIYNF